MRPLWMSIKRVLERNLREENTQNQKNNASKLFSSLPFETVLRMFDIPRVANWCGFSFCFPVQICVLHRVAGTAKCWGGGGGLEPCSFTFRTERYIQKTLRQKKDPHCVYVPRLRWIDGANHLSTGEAYSSIINSTEL